MIRTATTPAAQGGLGFALAGVCAAHVPPLDVKALRQWIAEGNHGQMAYMKEQEADRVNPDRVLSGARSVFMVADQYHPRDSGNDTFAARERDGTDRGTIARYARGRDYHRTIKVRLHRLADALRATYPRYEHRSFVDTAPVLERRFAQLAGLGWIGKNAMLINPSIGSYVLLGGFLTTIDLGQPQAPALMTDHCGTCTRCIDACPTAAIANQPLHGAGAGQPRVDGSRCIAYLTIEHQGDILPSLAPAVGDRVFGCDVCQEVCPHNAARTSDTPLIDPAYHPARATVPLAEMLHWQSPDRSLLTVSAMKRATTEMFRRNAAIAMNNLRSTKTPGAQAPGE